MSIVRYEHGKLWIQECGKRLRDAVKTELDFTCKSSHKDLVSRYDAEIELFLREQIALAYPTDVVIGEEFDNLESEGDVWYIDPIDGTANFIHQHMNFAVSIGFYQNNQPVFGLVLDVMNCDLYAAYYGQGATCNGKPIQTKCTADLQESILYMPIVPFDPVEIGNLGQLVNKVCALRCLGSVALEICMLSCGKGDVFLAEYSSPWDHNAAKVILKEAGGYITAATGTSLPIDTKSTVLAAANFDVWKKALAELI